MRRLHSAVFPLFLLISFGASAQSRVSAEVEVKSLAGKSVVTTNKSVYCSGNGRLVVNAVRPSEYVMTTNIGGETSVYFPKTKEVYVPPMGMTSSRDELLSIFLLGRIEDLGVGLMGYRLTSTEYVEGGLMKRSYTGTDKSMPPRVEIVYGSDYLPIYSATMAEDGTVTAKVYYTHYEPVGYIPFPHRLTQINYTSGGDSTIVRTVYSDVVLDGDDPMFDFIVPADAVPVSLPDNMP